MGVDEDDIHVVRDGSLIQFGAVVIDHRYVVAEFFAPHRDPLRPDALIVGAHRP